MSASIKQCILIGKNTLVGPFDSVEESSSIFKVCIEKKYGAYSKKDGSKILSIEWDEIDDFPKFPHLLRIWKNGFCGIYSIENSRFLVEPVWKFVKVRTDTVFILFDDLHEHFYELR